jgi:F-type H+-transporting ATPase subunit epsilon
MADSQQASGKSEGSRGGTQGVRCVIVTPETTILDTRARFVTLPLFDGQRGVGRGHAPFIGRLGSGEVRILDPVSGVSSRGGESVQRVFVEGGFAEVGHDSVTVITQRAVPAEKLDAARAREELEKVRTTAATGDEAIAAKLRAEETARALLRAAEQARK